MAVDRTASGITRLPIVRRSCPTAAGGTCARGPFAPPSGNSGWSGTRSPTPDGAGRTVTGAVRRPTRPGALRRPRPAWPAGRRDGGPGRAGRRRSLGRVPADQPSACPPAAGRRTRRRGPEDVVRVGDRSSEQFGRPRWGDRRRVRLVARPDRRRKPHSTIGQVARGWPRRAVSPRWHRATCGWLLQPRAKRTLTSRRATTDQRSSSDDSRSGSKSIGGVPGWT